MAARYKAWVCGRSPAEIVGSNPVGGHGRLSLVRVVCCQVEVSATSWSLAQRSPTDCGVFFEREFEASTIRRFWLPRVCCAMGKKELCCGLVASNPCATTWNIFIFRPSFFWGAVWRGSVTDYRRFGTTHIGPIPKDQAIRDPWPVKARPVCVAPLSRQPHNNARRANITEERKPQLHRGRGTWNLAQFHFTMENEDFHKWSMTDANFGAPA